MHSVALPDVDSKLQYTVTDGFVILQVAQAEPRYPDADAVPYFPVCQLAQPIREWCTTIGCHVRDDLSRS